jgi:hypothetical protein
MTYKELWKKQNPDKNFDTAGCRDYEFSELLQVSKNCDDKRCTSCWDEECEKEEE